MSHSIALTQNIANQIIKKGLRPRFFLTINGTDFSSYLITQNIQSSRQYGVASATITLNNDGRFSRGGANEIKVGDVVETGWTATDGGHRLYYVVLDDSDGNRVFVRFARGKTRSRSEAVQRAS